MTDYSANLFALQTQSGCITRAELSYFRAQRAIPWTGGEIMASDARPDGMSLSPEVPLPSTCKDLQSNSDVFGCDARPNAICIRYSWKKTANRRYLTHNTDAANFARLQVDYFNIRLIYSISTHDCLSRGLLRIC